MRLLLLPLSLLVASAWAADPAATAETLTAPASAAPPASQLTPAPAKPAATITPPVAPITAAPLASVQAYSQDQLAQLIRDNQHLQQVKKDNCQLVEDIQDRAIKLKEPTYQFLYGDMLSWGVCYPTNAELGLHYLKEAANQGYPEALEQLGRYYRQGTLVQKDGRRAMLYTREAASVGSLKAQLALVKMLLAGQGSPYDYADAYRWLHNAVIADKKTHARAQSLLKRLGNEMPASEVERAKRASIVQ